MNLNALELSCVYNHRNGLGRIRTSCIVGNIEVSLVTVKFWNAEVYMKVDYVCCSFNWFRLMERTVYLEKEN